MSKYSLAIFALAATISTCGYAADPKETLGSFHAALAAGDKAKAEQLLAPDVVIYESGYVERSRAEYASHHLPHDIDFAKTATRRVVRQSERIEGNTAIIWEETETKGKARGKEVRLVGTETALLEKRGDTWVIVHVHWSSRTEK